MEDFLKEPQYAALFAAVVTGGYIVGKAHLNNQPAPQNSDIFKPAILVAILVYFIVTTGLSAKETISVEPF